MVSDGALATRKILMNGRPVSRINHCALLFDIDGTLADTDALHLEAYNTALAPFGHVFDQQRYARELQGFSARSICDRFLASEAPQRQAAVIEEKEAVFRNLVAGRIVPTPGLMALLDRADAAGVPMVAVTNAPRLNAELLLSGLRITDRFKAIVIGDELAHGKPHPLPYLEGLRRAGAAADASVAFEDTRSGVASATAAGIATIGIRTGLSHEELAEAGAVATARTFEDSNLLALIATKMRW
jgi:HAD superfamily hydrolase (TIGR01509 family)